jgi:choline-glycine betaine transporter
MPKEAAMKDKYLNAVILVVVATGTVMASFVGGASQGVEHLQTAFFAFIAAIIVIQVLPALMLIGTLLKGILARPAKELESAATLKGNEP